MRLDRPVPWAIWLALCFHGPLVAAGLFRYSFDAYVHLFLADHYRRAWFGLWEPRWFGGFSVDSYPPLVHQLLALLSFPFGLERAFGLLLLASLVVLPLAIERFARLFVPPAAAGGAALVGVFLPAIALAANDFGQLPTLVALVLALLCLAEYAGYVETGSRGALALAAALAGATTSAHHATSLLFLPPAALACVAAALMRPSVASIFDRLGRAAVAALASAITGALVILPFWGWAAAGVHQTPIPHLTRANFMVDFGAQAQFYWAPYSVLPALALIGLWTKAGRRSAVLVALGLLFGLLGLGGTTSLPAVLFGGQWQWLTYDRFALWATITLLPLAGLAVADLWTRPGVLPSLAIAVAVVVLALYATIDSVLSPLEPAQPYQVDLQPIAAFLNEGDRARWRYQTFGFGESATQLGCLANAATIDGGYFSARRLPELVESGIGQVDYALWWDPSGKALRRILSRATVYSIRWAFVRESQYGPYLTEAGFHRRELLPEGVEVWENAEALPLASDALDFGRPDLAGVLWGTLPVLTVAAAAGLAAARLLGHRRTTRAGSAGGRRAVGAREVTPRPRLAAPPLLDAAPKDGPMLARSARQDSPGRE